MTFILKESSLSHETFDLACDASKILYLLDVIKPYIRMPVKEFKCQQGQARTALEIAVRTLVTKNSVKAYNFQNEFKSILQEFLTQAAASIDWSRYFDFVVRQFHVATSIETSNVRPYTIAGATDVQHMLSTLRKARNNPEQFVEPALQNGRYLTAIHTFSSLSRNCTWFPLFMRMLPKDMAKAKVLAKFFQQKYGSHQGRAEFAKKANNFLNTDRYSESIEVEKDAFSLNPEALYSLNLVFNVDAIIRNPRLAAIDLAVLQPMLANLEQPQRVTLGSAEAVAHETLTNFWKNVEKAEQEAKAVAEIAKKKAIEAIKLKANEALVAALATLDSKSKNALKDLSTKEFQTLLANASQPTTGRESAKKPRATKSKRTEK